MIDIKKDTDLPHLRIPTHLRRYIRQCGEALGVEFKKARYQISNSNYVYKTSIITLDDIDDIEANHTRESRVYNSANLYYNARCFLNDDTSDLRQVQRKKMLSLKDQSQKIGKDGNLLAVHKSNNSLYYRYLRFLGRGDFVEATELMEEYLRDMTDFITDIYYKFNMETHLIRLIIDNQKVNRISFKSCKNTLNYSLSWYELNFYRYKNIKRIFKILNKIDFEKIDTDEDGLYYYYKGSKK